MKRRDVYDGGIGFWYGGDYAVRLVRSWKIGYSGF